MTRNKARIKIMFVSLVWSIFFVVLMTTMPALNNFESRHLLPPNEWRHTNFDVHQWFVAGLIGGAIMFFGTLIATFLFPPGERPKSTNRHS